MPAPPPPCRRRDRRDKTSPRTFRPPRPPFVRRGSRDRTHGGRSAIRHDGTRARSIGPGRTTRPRPPPPRLSRTGARRRGCEIVPRVYVLDGPTPYTPAARRGRWRGDRRRGPAPKGATGVRLPRPRPRSRSPLPLRPRGRAPLTGTRCRAEEKGRRSFSPTFGTPIGRRRAGRREVRRRRGLPRPERRRQRGGRWSPWRVPWRWLQPQSRGV
mmetsp:Transcript_33811/g.100861  ORF Transcript_33811/g.100861 Transcript_33811/m.100861 type:complete len:213 (+) Transcript_33811:1913-2551(+)